MSSTNWPDDAQAGDPGSPRLYDAGTADDWADILTARRTSLLLCGDDAALDRQAQALLQGLRKSANVETALLFDMDRALLLERFNRLLANLSVEQARASASAVVRVWIFQVQTAPELEQARLLLRLSQDLPGSGVVVLLLTSVRLARDLAPEGSNRRLQVRVVGDPWARTEGTESDAARQEPSLVARSAAAPVPPAAPAPAPRRGMKTSVVVLTGLTLLAVSAGAVIWQRTAETRRAPEPVVKVAAPSASAPLPVLQASAVVAVEAASSAAVAAAPASVAAASASAAAPGTAMPPPGGKTLPPAVETAVAPREQVARTASWIDAQPESSWLVQHAVSWRAADMLDLRSRQPALADARIVALYRNDGRVYYALVSGPFETSADARVFDKNLPKLATPSWVRSVSRVKKELEEPSGAGVTGLPAAPR